MGESRSERTSRGVVTFSVLPLVGGLAVASNSWYASDKLYNGGWLVGGLTVFTFGPMIGPLIGGAGITSLAPAAGRLAVLGGTAASSAAADSFSFAGPVLLFTLGTLSMLGADIYLGLNPPTPVSVAVGPDGLTIAGH